VTVITYEPQWHRHANAYNVT